MVEPQIPLLPKAGKFWEVFLGSDHSWGALAPCQSSQLRARPALSRLQAALGVLRRPTKAKEWAWMQGLKAECSLTAFRALGPVWPGGRRPRDGDTLPTLPTEPFPVLLPPPRGGVARPICSQIPSSSGSPLGGPAATRSLAHQVGTCPTVRLDSHGWTGAGTRGPTPCGPGLWQAVGGGAGPGAWRGLLGAAGGSLAGPASAGGLLGGWGDPCSLQRPVLEMRWWSVRMCTCVPARGAQRLSVGVISPSS